MATITIRIPQELKERMDSLDEINWSAVTRNLLQKKVEEYYVLEKLKEAEEDIKAGRLVSHKEFFKKFKNEIQGNKNN